MNDHKDSTPGEKSMRSQAFKKLRWVAIASLLACGAGAWAQSLEVTTATELRLKPALDAKAQAKLARGTLLEQTGSQGGWIKVKSGNQEGWVRQTHVKSAESAQPAAASSANPLTGLTGMFSASSNRPTATTGTRGLTQEQLANAQPAPAEVLQLEHYAVTSNQAEQYARSGKLAQHPINAYTGAEK